MATAALTSLMNYLYVALTPSNMRWVGEHLIQYADKQATATSLPYTMEEINSRLDQSEREFAQGKGISSEIAQQRMKDFVASVQ